MWLLFQNQLIDTSKYFKISLHRNLIFFSGTHSKFDLCFKYTDDYTGNEALAKSAFDYITDKLQENEFTPDTSFKSQENE